MPSAKFDEYKGYYDSGKWTKEMVHMATERGSITEAEYLTITKEEYVPIIYKYEGGLLTDLMEKRLITGDPNASSNTSSGDDVPDTTSGNEDEDPTSDGEQTEDLGD